VRDPHRAASEEVSSESSVSPADLRAKVGEMMNAGISEETIAAYVRDAKLARPLTADEILEWKKAGIAESVIRAAIAHRN
jgi:cytochrome c-type biogenesis protein CcmH/NrfF